MPRISNNLADSFAQIAELPIWAPRDKRKCLHNGMSRLSVSKPEHWMTLAEARKLVDRCNREGPHLNIEDNRLCGVSLILTGLEGKGVTVNGWRLVGIDIDNVTDGGFKQIALTHWLNTYWETSPSGNGLHGYIWAPEKWAEQYADNAKVKLPHCDHAEIYIGSSPRHLTVTGKRYGRCRTIGHLDAVTQKELGKLLKPAKAPRQLPPAGGLEAGTAIALDQKTLTPEQRHLIDGTGNIDRSQILHGWLIKMIDSGVNKEDCLATMLESPALWKYCMDHRHDNPERAMQFAKEEIGRAYAKSQTGMREALVGYNSKWKDVVEVKPAANPPERPQAPVEAFPDPRPGPMAEAVDAALRVAPKPQPELTTLAVLVTMASVCGSYYALPSGSRLNLYGCGIADTGAGKDMPKEVACAIAEAAGVRVIGKPASGQGLEDVLADHIGILVEIDELAHYLAAVNGYHAPTYLIELNGNLLKLFSASKGIYHCRIRAGAEEPKSVRNPAVNLIGFATPGRLGQALTEDNITEGLLGRFLYAIGREDVQPRRVSAPLVLPASVRAATKWVDTNRTWLRLVGPRIGVTDTAAAMLDTMLADFYQRSVAATSPSAKALLQRSFEKVERIAGLLAVWDNWAKPEIGVPHVEWAAQFVRASDAAVLRFAEDFMHGGQVQADAAKVLSLLRRVVRGELTTTRASEAAAPAGWASRSHLLRVSKLEVRRFDQALDHLEALGDIKFDAVQHPHPNGRGEKLRILRPTI